MILASALMFVSCVDEMATDSFDNIKLDKTMLVLPVTGGTVELNVTADEAWSFDTLYTKDAWPNVITRKKNDAGEYYVSAVEKSWLSVDKLAGEAGETVLKFSADSVAGGREIELCIKAGKNSQFVKVRQGSLEAESATCADVIAGPDGKTYRVKGVCTGIANTTYGNWYLNDGTGEVYVYGTLDKDGKTKNYESWGMEIGDVVEVEGPKLTYGTTIELVDVTVISIQKSLVKVITEEKTFEKEGGEFEVKVAYKGDGLYPVVADTCKTWVSLVGVKSYSGTPTKIEPNPADTAIVTFSLAPFDEKAAPRKGFLTFTSASGKNSTDVVYNITQKGNIPDVLPIAEAVKEEYVYIEGTVMALCTRGYVLGDETGSILIYYGSEYEGGHEIGDKMGVLGPMSVYNFASQIQTIDFEQKLSEEPEEVTYPDAVVYDGAKVNALMESLADKTDVKDAEAHLNMEYAKVVGKLVVSGNYLNLEIPGTNGYQGSVYNAIESLNLKSYDGKTVELSGYVSSVSLSSGAPKYLNIIVTAVKEASDVFIPELKFSKTSDKVEADATEYSFDITSNLDWTLTASEGVTLDKTSGKGNATVTMTFAANETDEAIVHTVTAKAEGVADKVLKITQATAAAPTVATAAEINAAADDETKLYEVTGYITEVVNDKYGNIYIKDATGEVYVYGTLDAEGKSANWSSLNISAGDIVTVVGPKTSYNNSPQLKNVSVKAHKPVTKTTVQDFKNASVADDVYYRLSGTVKNIAMDKTDPTLQNVYGNFDIEDETGSVYVYGLLSGWGGQSKQFRELNIKEGDTVTLVGVRADYKGTAQVGSAFLVSHEAVSEE